MDLDGEYRDMEYPDLVKIPGIRSIVGRAGFGPIAWKSFSQLPQLERFVSDDAGDVTNEELGFLHQLMSLEVLSIQATVHHPAPVTWPGRRQSFSAVALKPLSKMPHLRQLALRSDNLTDAGMENIAEVPELLTLKLDGHFGNEALKSVGKLTKLKRLSLAGHFDDEGLQYLGSLTNLESLCLSSPHLKGAGLAKLAALSDLRYFRIREISPDLSLAELKQWPALEALHLGDKSITDTTLQTLAELPQLRSLTCAGAAITDNGLAAFGGLHHLEELNLISTSVTDAGLESLSQNRYHQKTLRRLCLGETGNFHDSPKITQSGLQALSRLSHLEELDLRQINLLAVDLNVLESASLRRLCIQGLDGQEKARASRLLKRLPLLNRRLDVRVMIRADLSGRSEILDYDFLFNQILAIL